uniref:NACHT domain-containing protein n=1 Tax=Mola mola TaxID=94237 RepID=A0A3Q3XDY1_MOLML
ELLLRSKGDITDDRKLSHMIVQIQHVYNHHLSCFLQISGAKVKCSRSSVRPTESNKPKLHIFGGSLRSFMFTFTFRELNVLREKKYSLVELVHHFFPETKEAGICRFEEFQLVFIFDGLDECRLPLDFHNKETLTDVTKSTSVDLLLTNLIRGNLLPSARLWITTRPAAANQIPPECVDKVTEVRGFTDPQKEEYFRNRYRDEEQASRIISHIKTSRSFHIMCHIPVFCWITATVLEDVLKTSEGGELPRTLTEMYIHFLLVQSKVKNLKYDGGAATDQHWSPESRKMIESLGKLAFEQLQKGNLIFYESDLTECGIDIRAASVYSGVFTQIFKEERGLYQHKVFCFVHLSVQEFLAALHVHLTFTKSGVNLLSGETSTSQSEEIYLNQTHLYKSAVDKALESSKGHLDLFLRFLLGLSLETNQTLLRGLMTLTENVSKINKETVTYIHGIMADDLSPERSINLFHCLNELNDDSLVEDIQKFLRSGWLPTDEMEKDLEVFDLKKYTASEEAFLKLLPVVKVSNKAVLSYCNLSEESCEALSSVLSSLSSSLTELDLSNNYLVDSELEQLCLEVCFSCHELNVLVDLVPEVAIGSNGQVFFPFFFVVWYQIVKLISKFLRGFFCNLILTLNMCLSCEALSSVLSSQSSSLTELDLSNNHMQDSRVERLCAGLKSPHCKLERLRLSGCLITEEGCTSLASALTSNPSHLRELDLSYNHPGGSGVELLSAGLKDPHWRLDTLRYTQTTRAPTLFLCHADKLTTVGSVAAALLMTVKTVSDVLRVSVHTETRLLTNLTPGSAVRYLLTTTTHILSEPNVEKPSERRVYKCRCRITKTFKVDVTHVGWQLKKEEELVAFSQIFILTHTCGQRFTHVNCHHRSLISNKPQPS